MYKYAYPMLDLVCKLAGALKRHSKMHKDIPQLAIQGKIRRVTAKLLDCDIVINEFEL